MKWALEKVLNGIWTEYRLFLEGSKVAYAKWAPCDDDESVELHNEIWDNRKSVLVKVREVFHEVVRKDVSSAGFKHIVVINTSEEALGTMVKYWSFMGFTHIMGIMEA